MDLDVAYYYDIRVKTEKYGNLLYKETHTVIAPTAIMAWLKCLDQGYSPEFIFQKPHD
jgi:hypothetical protein